MQRTMRLGTIVTSVILMTWVLSGCGRSPEARSALFVAEGKEFLQKKDPARAILQFQNAVKATPKDAEVRYQLALAYLAAGDPGRAVASLREALELNPKHSGAQLRMAQLLSLVNSPDTLKDAQQRLQRLLEQNPGNSDALNALGLTEIKLGNAAAGIQHLELALATAPQDLVFAYTAAQAKLDTHDVKGAEEVLKGATAKSPKSVDAAILLGRFYLAQNRAADAEQELRRALSLDPNSGAALLNMALLLDQTGREKEAIAHFQRLATGRDKTLQPSYGMFLYEHNRLDEAIREFDRLRKQDPADSMARTRLVVAYEAANRIPDAQKVLAEALKKNSKDPEALLQRGELSMDAGKLAEAESDLNQVLHLRPDSPQVHFVLARLYGERGITLRQRQELNEVLRLNPNVAAARVELAKSLMMENPKAALGVLDGAPADQSRQVSVFEQRNWALIGLGQASEARKGVDLGLASIRTPDFLLQDAILKISDKRYPEARQSIHEALTKAPEDVRALRLLVRSYVPEKQLVKAVEQVAAHVAEHPKSAALQYFLGNLLLETGDQARAKQALVAAKAINPAYRRADLSLAQIDLKEANWKGARQELSNVLTLDNENPLARRLMGMLELSVGNQAAAITEFRKAVEARPDDAIALNNLAYLLVENGQADEALKDAQRAQELAPDDPEIEDTLGWVLYQKGLFDAAVTHLKSAVSKGGGARQQYHLAMACFKAGQGEQGQRALQAALRKDPNMPEAKVAQEVSRENEKGRAR